MPLDIGYIELGGGGITARIYYQQGWGGRPDFMDAPLVNGPRGWCLDLTNPTGKNVTLEIAGVADKPLTVTIGQGDPVTSGPSTGRSRTAAQLAALGFTTRGNVGSISISD